MPSPPSPGAAHFDVPLRPSALLAAWHPTNRLLVVPVPERIPAAIRWIQLRISLVGLGAAATVTGRVAGTLIAPDASLVRVEPDAARLRALERLVAVAAAGAPVSYGAREPRVLVTVPAVVLTGAGPTYMCTVDVSANGCGLAWSGPAPAPGAQAAIRLGAGRAVAAVSCEVRWVQAVGRGSIVGMQVTGGDRDGWGRMHASLQRSGAPPV